MIAGKVYLEDVVVQWADRPIQGRPAPSEPLKNGELSVSITDVFGRNATFIADGRKFMQALVIALSWDGDVPNEHETHARWWAESEALMAEHGLEGVLRLIP